VFNISPLEMMVIAVIALIVLGPARLPEVARSIGRGMREFRGALSGIAGDDDEDEDQDEDDELDADDEVDDEIPPPPLPTKPPGDYQNDAESSESSSSSSGLV
jgi:TatA/E family protein of Tat protein translocase